jgi:aryl-alcohol dehydrogenase-like predicted oxidoreductase
MGLVDVLEVALEHNGPGEEEVLEDTDRLLGDLGSEEADHEKLADLLLQGQIPCRDVHICLQVYDERPTKVNNTPIERVLWTLTDAVKKDGVVDHIGGSSMWAWQFAKALYTSDRLGLERFKTMQNHYNLAYREEEREMIPLCREEGIALNPWSPLARGFLTGRYKRSKKPRTARYRTDIHLNIRYFRPEDFDVVERLEEVAEEKGVRPAQLALAWLLSKKGVTSPVVGPTSVGQLDELVEVVHLKLKGDDVERLEEPYRPHPVLGHS